MAELSSRDGGNYMSLAHYIYSRTSIPGVLLILSGFVSETMGSIILSGPDDSLGIDFTILSQ